eukprot:gene10564-3083_t
MTSNKKKSVEGSPELFSVRNNLYFGNYSNCLSIGSELELKTPELKVERDILLYRANIGLGQYELVLNEIDDSKDTPYGLRSIRLLAEYFLNGKEKVIEKIEEYLLDPIFSTDLNLLIVSSTIYTLEGDYLSSIKLMKDMNNLEMCSILISNYLSINRIDLAEKTLKIMSEKNDDASITQLSTASIYLSKGEDKLILAESIYQELIEKYTESVSLLNGKAIVCLKEGRYDEANKILLQALSKRNQDSETLINLIVCSQHLDILNN